MAYTGFNKSQLIDNDYLDQLKDALVPKMITEGITAKLVTILPNVKNAATLNLIDNTIDVQEGGCGFNPSGNVALIQRELRVYRKKVNDTLCPDDLYSTFLSTYMRGNELPFTEVIANQYVNRINAFNENWIWGGDSEVDGLLKVIADDTHVVNAASEVASASGYIAKLNALMAKAPTEVKTADDGIVFCSFGFFDNYANELRAANLYMAANDEYATGGYIMTIPGTNKKLVATSGIDNSGISANTGELLVYTTAKNIVIGTDMLLQDSPSDFSMWYSQDNQEYRVAANWAIGVNYRWSEFVVKGYTLA